MATVIWWVGEESTDCSRIVSAYWQIASSTFVIRDKGQDTFELSEFAGRKIYKITPSRLRYACTSASLQGSFKYRTSTDWAETPVCEFLVKSGTLNRDRRSAMEVTKSNLERQYSGQVEMYL